MFAGVIGTAVATAEQRRVPYGRGVSFEEVRLDGEFPDTQLVILLRAESHPGVLFGRRRRLWEQDGSRVEMADILIGIHLQEESGPASLDSRPIPTLTRRALRGSEPPAVPRSGCRIANSSRLGITGCATLCRSACIFWGLVRKGGHRCQQRSG